MYAQASGPVLKRIFLENGGREILKMSLKARLRERLKTMLYDYKQKETQLFK